MVTCSSSLNSTRSWLWPCITFKAGSGTLERALEQLWLILEEGNFDEFDDSLKRIGQEFPHLIVVKMRKSYAFDFETPLANGVLT